MTAYKETAAALCLMVLLGSFLSMANSVNAAETVEQIDVDFKLIEGSEQGVYGGASKGQWWKIETDVMTVLIPMHERRDRRPLFVWWYSDDTDNIFVVKFKGLIEYLNINHSHYVRKNEATEEILKKHLENVYGRGSAQTPITNFIDNESSSWELHPAFLQFTHCLWNLTGPATITRVDGVSYISFNFTLEEAPPDFYFAENNVVIRVRFYLTDATENVYDGYTYDQAAGELKLDLVVKNWEWNVDKLDSFWETLHNEFNVTASNLDTSLALWINLASIRMASMGTAENDAKCCGIRELVEPNSKTTDFLIGKHRIQVHENETAKNIDEIPLSSQDRGTDRYQLRFADGPQPLAGFLDFLDQATIVDATEGSSDWITVAPSYISGGNYLRLYIGYPYFGNKTLEHDPSIGVEGIAMSNGASWPLIAAISVCASMIVAITILILRKKHVKKQISSSNQMPTFKV